MKFLAFEILTSVSSIVVVYKTRYMSESSMWSILSDDYAARIVIPFKIVMTSSVFKLVFKKVFSAVCWTNFSNSANFTCFFLLQVAAIQMLYNLTLKSLSLNLLIATRKPNRHIIQVYHSWM